ncbi:MAG: phosphoenolpyruvate carboxylase [bacterium]|nr:phosphoenolpyruvate carboxylase [bacterium]
MKGARKIPAVMFSQHPDNAGRPYWHDHPCIKTHHELKECHLMFKDMGADEVMWDWEGKLVDEAVIEKLWSEYPKFFKNNPLGKKIFLTFRIPNPSVESGYRLGRAFMVILSARDLVDNTTLATPLFEIILPMTESAHDLIRIHEIFKGFSAIAHSDLGANKLNGKPLEIIPLFEKVHTILNSKSILLEYINLYKKEFKTNPLYLRPFCARSDPALNSGIVPTTLAIKWALSEYANLAKECGVDIHPIIGPGPSPFRGGFTPDTTDAFLKEFSGIKTFLVQSSFRYDYPLHSVNKAIKKISKNNQNKKALAKNLSKNILQEIEQIIPWFEKPYQKTVEKIAPLINLIAPYIPKRRERVQHIGLFGYSRKVGKTKLPRAIGFTASCYSLGLPPELFGLGTGLAKAKKENKIKLIQNLYQSLDSTIITAGKYLRKESLVELGLTEMAKDIKLIEEYIGKKFGPTSAKEKKHVALSGEIIKKILKKKNPTQEIEQAALLRQWLG